MLEADKRYGILFCQRCERIVSHTTFLLCVNCRENLIEYNCGEKTFYMTTRGLMVEYDILPITDFFLKNLKIKTNEDGLKHNEDRVKFKDIYKYYDPNKIYWHDL